MRFSISFPLTEQHFQVQTVRSRDGGVAAVGGAALAAGVVGALVSGPIVAVAAAGVAGTVAATRNDEVGSLTRKVGVATVSTINAAAKFNEEHQVTARLYEGAKDTANKAAAFDKKHHVTQTLGQAALQTSESAKAFAKDHHLKEKAAAAASALYSGAAAAASKAKELDSKYKVTDKISAAAEKGWNEISTAVDKKNATSTRLVSAGPWTCPQCTFVNSDATAVSCSICGSPPVLAATAARS